MQDHQERQSPKPQGQPENGTPQPIPPAGPHAREDLTDTDKTPGTGSLPDPDGAEADVGSD